MQLEDCYLNEKQLQKLLNALKDFPQIYELNVSGTSCNAESLKILLTYNLNVLKTPSAH